MSVVPFTGASSLGSVARRTTAVAVALAVALVALVLVTAWAARHPHTDSATALPVRSGDIIVLDLSASVSQDTYSRIGETLKGVIATGGRYGLVVFSGVAYEALPPGTPASAFRPLVRYFTLPEQTTPGYAPTFPPNPWNTTFSGGTEISSGLYLARSLLLENKLRHASVVLVSDLHDDPEDRNRLNEIVAQYQREGIHVRVVPLGASLEDAAYFSKLTSTALKDAPVPTATPSPTPAALAPSSSSFPYALVLLVAAAACALAANLLWSARLRWSDA